MRIDSFACRAAAQNSHQLSLRGTTFDFVLSFIFYECLLLFFTGFTEDEVVQTVEELDYNPECPVCLQPCSHPVKLPCGHIFCFLCIKGVVLRSRKCALCRQSLAVEYFEKATLIKVVNKANKEEKATKPKEKTDGETDQDADDFVWYYEGRNGWWSYDEKTSLEVEKAFKSGQRSCILLIAGFLYVVDFENMFQTRKNEPGRRRRIKRDKKDVESKGVAGIRIPASSRSNSTSPTQTVDSRASDKRGNGENRSEIGPYTPEESTNGETTQPQTSGESTAQQAGADEITTRLEETSFKDSL